MLKRNKFSFIHSLRGGDSKGSSVWKRHVKNCKILVNLGKLKIDVLCLLYISTSVWVLGTPSTDQNMLLQCFLCKENEKRKKEKN